MPFQILALNGGGFFGYYTACVLTHLEELAGRPLARCFDLLTGTSVGGIIALGLAREIPAVEIKRTFEAHGAKIFSDRPKPKGLAATLREVARSAIRPKFDGLHLRDTVTSVLGDTRLQDLAHWVLVPVVDLDGAQARVIASHRASDAGLKAADVAMAATASPTFFPIAEIEGRFLVDGGLFANAPDLVALDEAEGGLNVPFGDIRLLSIGTATAYFAAPEPIKKDLGAIAWMMGERLMRTTMAAQQSSADTVLKRRLQDRYLRIDSRQSPAQQESLGLHVANEEARRILAELALGAFNGVAQDTRLQRMLEHRSKG